MSPALLCPNLLHQLRLRFWTSRLTRIPVAPCCTIGIMRAVRIPLFGFPDVVLHADELAVKKSPYYSAAKGGDADAAALLVADMVQRDCTTHLMMPMRSRQARLLPIHALESKGVNEIPAAMAKLLSGTWSRIRRLVARNVRIWLRLPYPVGSSLPRKLPGCSNHSRSSCCGRT
jgi:hypothetical protein